MFKFTQEKNTIILFQKGIFFEKKKYYIIIIRFTS